MIYMVITLVTVCGLMLLEYIGKRYAVCFGDSKIKIINSKNLTFLFVFAILAFFSAIRDGVGCDYDSYMMHIQKIQTGSSHYMEIGFKWVCLLVAQINNNPRAVIIIFAIATCYFYLKSIWDQSDNKVLSVFIFLTWGYYFFTYNTIRNYFALALVLWSIKYLINKKYFKFIAIVIIASLFHKSALICIPLYFLATRKYSMKHIGILVIISLIAVGFKNQIREIMFTIYPSYENSVYDTGDISILNILKAIFVIILCLFYNKKVKENDLLRFYFNLNIFALLFYTVLYWTPEASRIGFYMNATTIFLIPCIVSNISNSKNKLLLNTIIIIGSLILFGMLLLAFASPTTRLLPYKTWLFNNML